MSTHTYTLASILSRRVIDEIIILPKDTGEQQGQGYSIANDCGENKVFTRANNQEIYLPPDTLLEDVEVTGPYEGVTFYRIVSIGTEKEDEDTMWEKALMDQEILHPELLIHLKDKDALSNFLDRRIDLHGKVKDWLGEGYTGKLTGKKPEPEVKQLVDIIQSAVMLLHTLGEVAPEIALYQRNSELRHRLAQTGSMLRKK
jgi:hypothetical protein